MPGCLSKHILLSTAAAVGAVVCDALGGRGRFWAVLVALVEMCLLSYLLLTSTDDVHAC